MFFFNDTATTEIYTLSLHDALPISCLLVFTNQPKNDIRSSVKQKLFHRINMPYKHRQSFMVLIRKMQLLKYQDRKSTRLNSSHANISYAVFCLKKKNRDMPAPTTSV